MKNFFRLITHFFRCLTGRDEITAPPTLPVKPYDPDARQPGEEEKDYFVRFIQKRRKCPDCYAGDLLAGPEGGCSVNFRCNNCASGYNIAFAMGEIWYVHRID
jgi:hypothetical protein